VSVLIPRYPELASRIDATNETINPNSFLTRTRRDHADVADTGAEGNRDFHISYAAILPYVTTDVEHER